MDTLGLMEQRLKLNTYGERLWTRDLARAIRVQVRERLEALQPGDVLVLDTQGVEVFDYSFADELFGRTLLTLPQEYPGRFVLVEGLSTYTQENLAKALETLGLMMIERRHGTLQLIGKVHPAHQETFAAIVQTQAPVDVDRTRPAAAGEPQGHERTPGQTDRVGGDSA